MSFQTLPGTSDRGDRPWWLVAFVLAAVVIAAIVAVSDLYTQVFQTVAAGLGVTIFVTLAGFGLAMFLGLLIALLGMAQGNVLRQVARFYVEVIRGVPILVLLFYIAFVGTPAFVALYNLITSPLAVTGLVEPLVVRDISLMWRAIIALMIGYSAFIAEIFRAGFQSIDKGQIEAAMALGLNRYQRFRLVVFPQAIRVVFPPLSNDFVAMVKDSSLVSVLGVADITQMAKVYASGSFRFFETYSIVAYVYLLLTVGLSLVLRRLERRMRGKYSAA